VVDTRLVPNDGGAYVPFFSQAEMEKKSISMQIAFWKGYQKYLMTIKSLLQLKAEKFRNMPILSSIIVSVAN
jgi:hypothetical protein